MKKDILFLLWSSLVVVSAWVIFTIIHASTSTTIPPAINKQISPINPVFDTQTIDAVVQRDKIIPQFSLQNATISATPTPYQISGLIIPIASASSQTSSAGGHLK